jgi:hypothetical protein
MRESNSNPATPKVLLAVLLDKATGDFQLFSPFAKDVVPKTVIYKLNASNAVQKQNVIGAFLFRL